jgi:hypothetical protein
MKRKNSQKWWSDPVTLIPIIISIIALVVSGLSWWESRLGRLYNEETNRPVLSLTGIEPDINTLKDDKGERVIFSIRLSNSGKVTATLTRLEMLAMLHPYREDCDVDNVGDEESTTWGDGTGIVFAPGEEHTGILRSAIVSKTCGSLKFNLVLIANYSDPTGKAFIQRFEAPVTTSLPELQQRYKERWATPTPIPTPALVSTPSPTPQP